MNQNTIQLPASRQLAFIPLRWYEWLSCSAISFLIVNIGRDDSFAEMLRIPSYYSDLLLAFACTCIAFLYLKKMQLVANRKFSWQQLRKIIRWRLLYTFTIPLVVIMLIEMVYLQFMLNISIKDSSLFYLELPVTGLLLLLLNLAQHVLYLQRINKTNETVPVIPEPEIIEEVIPEVTPRFILVYRGSQAIHIPLNEIAYFVIINKTTFLVTPDNNKYLYNQSLQEIQQQLPNDNFFLLNRQMLVARGAVNSFEQTSTRRLLVNVVPALEEEMYVSKARAGIFTRWLDLH